MKKEKTDVKSAYMNTMVGDTGLEFTSRGWPVAFRLGGQTLK